MKSSMFIDQPTVIDHAYIDDRGHIIGGSFNPDFIVSGEVDPVEKVVVDFSTIKKTLKAIIDDREQGFDHKLWLFANWSKYQIKDVDVAHVEVTTPFLVLRMPRNAIKVLDIADEYCPKEVGVEMMLYLTVELRKVYPKINVSVEVHNAARLQNIVLDQNMAQEWAYVIKTFTYTHGLRNSTSWGCQNHSHGHLSFVQLYYQVTDELGLPGNSSKVLALADEIAQYIDQTIFVDKANIVPIEECRKFIDIMDLPGSRFVAIKYCTPERGEFSAIYDSSNLKVKVLDTETTIEYLIEHILSLFGDRLREAEVTRMFLSEGLSKGAMVEL